MHSLLNLHKDVIVRIFYWLSLQDICVSLSLCRASSFLWRRLHLQRIQLDWWGHPDYWITRRVSRIFVPSALREIYLQRFLGVDHRALRWIGRCRNLEVLDLGCHTHSNLGVLSKLERLETLTVVRGRWLNTDDSMLFRGMSRLRNLNLCQSVLTDDSLTHLGCATRLVRVNFSSNKGLGDKGISQLIAFETLTELNIRFCSITDSGACHLARLTALKVLDACYTRFLRRRGTRSLLELANLERLFYLQENFWITNLQWDDDLVREVSKHTKLSDLRMNKANTLEEESHRILMNLKIVHIFPFKNKQSY
eukprot:TRINITY_DN454_c0_g1_i10.p1 TRINITY_DN454_c0_g1~~TRINITY_DN454_c0_g1_i10.p1  ORF type:complete len:309 (+),score=-6.02 TRINITY_DN454_c0_g1_i10:628-1554(+)